MKWASVFLMAFFLLIVFSGRGGRSTEAYVALKPEPGRVTVFRLSRVRFQVGSEGPSAEQALRLREIVRERGGVIQEIRLEELPVVLSCGSDRVKVEKVPRLLLVDARGRVRYESADKKRPVGEDLADLSAWMDFLEQRTDIDESTWGKIKELFR